MDNLILTLKLIFIFYLPLTIIQFMRSAFYKLDTCNLKPLATITCMESTLACNGPIRFDSHYFFSPKIYLACIALRRPSTTVVGVTQATCHGYRKVGVGMSEFNGWWPTS